MIEEGDKTSDARESSNPLRLPCLSSLVSMIMERVACGVDNGSDDDHGMTT